MIEGGSDRAFMPSLFALSVEPRAFIEINERGYRS